MTQLIINGHAYPETSHDKYKCYPQELGETFRMINSRLVTEVRAVVMVIEYSYDYFYDEQMRQCLSDLRGRNDLTVQYLDPESGQMKTSVFRCTVKPSPTYAFSVGGVPRWHNINFTLEEVEGT